MAIDPQLKILLVEDSGTTRKMQIKVLEKLGLKNIVDVDDGSTAIQKLQEINDVGLIISDWNMPQKSGYDLLVWVRANDKHKNVPFIMATARGEKKQAAQAREAGVTGFITKPFGPLDLQRVIDDIFTDKSEQAGEKPERRRTSDSGKPILKVAHIQITDHLVLGVLNNQIIKENSCPQHFELETTCMPSWNPVQDALENGEVDAALVLAPIAMDLFGAGARIKLVLFAHKNGSISVLNKKMEGQSMVESLRGKTFYIPQRLSIHHMLTSMFLRQIGLMPGMAGEKDVNVFFEVVPPIKMPEFLASNPDAGGFTVAEPLGSKAIAAGSAELLFLTGELWERHPCCVVAMRDEFIDGHPNAVQEFVDLLVDSGLLIAQQPGMAAEVAVNFLDPEKTLGLKVPVLKNVLMEPKGIKTDDLFPVKEDLNRLQRYMVDKMGVGSLIDVNKFVDTQFAERAYKDKKLTRHTSSVQDLTKAAVNILSRRDGSDDGTMARMDREGKYLFFTLLNQSYGVNVLSIKEIIGIMDIRTLPKSPAFIKGVINLRGSVIPVIDLRLKMGLNELEYTVQTCIIILENFGMSGPDLMGIIVDTVSEVQNMNAEDLVDPPSLGTDVDVEFILAMAKTKDRVKIILNPDRLFSVKELEMMEAAV